MNRVLASRAVDCDVEIFAHPEDKPYQERQMGVRDAFGNVWWVARYMPDEGSVS